MNDNEPCLNVEALAVLCVLARKGIAAEVAGNVSGDAVIMHMVAVTGVEKKIGQLTLDRQFVLLNEEKPEAPAKAAPATKAKAAP